MKKLSKIYRNFIICIVVLTISEAINVIFLDIYGFEDFLATIAFIALCIATYTAKKAYYDAIA